MREGAGEDTAGAQVCEWEGCHRHWCGWRIQGKVQLEVGGSLGCMQTAPLM